MAKELPHNEGMRPYGKSSQLQKRCAQAQAFLAQGETVEKTARRVGVTARSIYRWRQEEKHPKKKNKAPLGKPAFLSKTQIKRLEKDLLRGAYAHGYSEDYWTLERIGHTVWELFKVRYTVSGIWRLMERMGWSCQKVQRLSIQREDDAVARWARYVWPRVKKNGAT
jgi:transposase